MDSDIHTHALEVSEISEWFDWLRNELSMGGVQLPDEESAVHYIYHALRLSDRLGEIAYYPESLRERLIKAAIIYQCWKLQRDQTERACLVRRAAVLPAMRALNYLERLGKSGVHHVVEAEDGFRYAVTIPNGLWVENLPAIEVVCNELARKLGLTVPTATIITLSPEILRQADLTRPSWDRARARLAAKACCGFRYVTPVSQVLTPKAFQPARNELLGRLVFNIWTGNFRGDRLVVQKDESTGRVRPIFFDHSECFYARQAHAFAAAAYKTHLCPHIMLGTNDEAALMKWVRRVQDLDLNFLWDLLVEMPPGWYGGLRSRVGEALQALESAKTGLGFAIKHMLNHQEYSARRYECRYKRGCAQSLACRIPLLLGNKRPPQAVRSESVDDRQIQVTPKMARV